MSNRQFLNRQSSPDAKRNNADTVYRTLSDALFDRVQFISLPFSQVNDAGETTSTTNFATDSRLIDTTGGKLFHPDKESRMRCNFYTKGASKLNGYILSPALLDSESLGTISDLESLRAYVGIKILEGDVYVTVKQNNGIEENYLIDFDIGTSTFSATFPLEIKYHVNYTEIFLDNTSVGSYATDFGSGDFGYGTFYPLFSPAKSTDGTGVNIVVENYQFIQSK